jgi:4-aminobutyrate aminotransferase
LPAIAEVRGAGLLVGIELGNIGTRDAADLAEAVLYRCLSAGLSFKVGQGNVLVLAPPLNVQEDDLWWAIDQIAIALHAECAA